MAALKARYVDYEHLSIIFPKRRKTRSLRSAKVSLHRAYNDKELNNLFELAKENITVYALVRFLYDAGSRI